jgi:DNA polymerase-3 subunit epsilon
LTDYLLFIDTETSGLPKNWRKPYSAEGNWPFCIQVAWIIYTKDRQVLKQENHFIKENDFKISKSATKIHGITHQFLEANGQSRNEVLEILSRDVIKFQPLVIGHFMEFDFKMLGVDFYRAEIENPIKKEMTFCTMLATTHMVKNPVVKFFKLGELYQVLFNTTLYNQHNALADAKATADCFFELVKRGEADDNTIAIQQKETLAAELKENEREKGCVIPLLFIIFLTFLIFFYL